MARWPGTWCCDRLACLKKAGRKNGQLHGVWSIIETCSYCGGVGERTKNTAGCCVRICAEARGTG